MLQFPQDPTCGPMLSLIEGPKDLSTFGYLFFCTDSIGSETRNCYYESVQGISLEYNTMTEHRNTVTFQKLDINHKIENLSSIFYIVQSLFNTGHSRSSKLSLQQFSL